MRDSDLDDDNVGRRRRRRRPFDAVAPSLSFLSLLILHLSLFLSLSLSLSFFLSPSLSPQLPQLLSPGDDPLSRFVNVLISIKPLYAAMKAGARVVLKNSAERAGVPWESAERALARQPVAAELEALRAALSNPRVVYPDYYTQPFHAYDEGNLCWLAAREVEAATASMAIRTVRTDPDPSVWDPAASCSQLKSSSPGGIGTCQASSIFLGVTNVKE